MKILHAVQRYLPAPLTGSEVYMKYLSEELVERGHGVTVLTSNAYDPQAYSNLLRSRLIKRKKDKIKNVEVIRFKIHSPISRFVSILNRMINLNRIFPRSFADLLNILAHGPLTPSLYKYIVKNSSLYDIIHCTPFPLAITYLAACASLKTELPLVVTPFFHFEIPTYYNKYLIDILKYLNAIIACTNLEKEKIVKTGVNPKKDPCCSDGS